MRDVLSAVLLGWLLKDFIRKLHIESVEFRQRGQAMVPVCVCLVTYRVMLGVRG